MRASLAALIAAAVTATSAAAADDLATRMTRGATLLALDGALHGGLSNDGSVSNRHAGATFGAIARRTWRGFYVQGGLLGWIDAGASGRISSSWGWGAQANAAVGYSFVVSDRVALSPGVIASVMTSRMHLSAGPTDLSSESWSSTVGVQIPVTVFVSERVFLEPYLHVERSWSDYTPTGVHGFGASVGHRLGLVL